MRRLLEIVALACLIFSLAVHLSTFAGVDPIDRVPYFWILHVLIFVVLGAAIFSGKRAVKGVKEDEKLIWSAAPRWLRWMTGVFFAYAFLNFALFLFMDKGTPSREGNHYYLHNHGRRIRDISEDEFHAAQARVARFFSGHWMMFYAASLVMLAGADRYESGKFNRQSAIEEAGEEP
jgi:hypothetical protein